MSQTSSSLPSRARVVIIGGGVIGTSIAYHLGHLGWTDTVLVERDQLTSGTTWHAAGLMVTFGSTSETSTELRKYTRDLYARLEAETGLATGFKPVGFIELAADEGRLEEYRRVQHVQPLLRRRRARSCRRARSPRCSRSPAPTTCSPASTSPATDASTRSTSRCRWRRAPARPASRSPRASPSTTCSPATARCAAWPPTTARSSASTSSTPPGCGPVSWASGRASRSRSRPPSTTT